MDDWRYRLLVCPLDHAPLHPNLSALECPACKRVYPVHDGIPSFVVADLAHHHDTHEWQWKQREMQARNEQSAFYDRLLGLMLLTPFEAAMTVRALRGDRPRFGVLAEIGCGTGRMLQRFAPYADYLVGADLSLASLQRCAERMQRLGLAERVLLVHADAAFLPFADATFDAVASCQMIEHVPSDRMRHRVVSEIARVLKPGGRYAISGYHYSWLVRAFKKEGVHKGGIYFFRFTRDEFLALIRPHLPVERLQSICGYAWLASGTKPLDKKHT